MDNTAHTLFKVIFGDLKASFAILGTIYSFYSIFKETSTVVDKLNFDFKLSVEILIASYVFFCIRSACNFFFMRFPIMSPESDKSISVRIGNILGMNDGTILIAINNDLIYDPKKIGSDSLHNQLIKKYGYNWMKSIIDEEKQKPKSFVGNKYPYGYSFTATAPHPKNKFLFNRKQQEFLFLVTSELQRDGVPTTSPKIIYESLNKLFADSNSFRLKNNRLYVPLIGTGFSALPYSRQLIAELIAFCFINNIKDMGGTVQHLAITFRPHTLDRINLVSLKENISAFIHNCKKCPKEQEFLVKVP